uniref:Sn1-specific diacylglycerol lipase beta isoform X2 n=1 Tax=Cicer arietinum TaxID=3827 RepID=A0A3Q7X5M3_CICAR|nr:sn1-specific diacylglycerol lipase beta isoform X2 [Cicer arietinum]
MGMGVRNLRRVGIILWVCNCLVFLFGTLLISHSYHLCDLHSLLPFLSVSIASLLRIVAMLQTAFAQYSAATLILNDSSDDHDDLLLRFQRRARYKKWLWWSRCTIFLTLIQFLSSTYLLLNSAYFFSKHTPLTHYCLLELGWNPDWWNHKLLSLFFILASFVAVAQCFTGSDVLKWRSFYQTHDNAWKSHYREVFDNGLRETLCCLGRVKYLTAIEEQDDVYSVARLLGDLVAYRASGTGHMELLAALALLQNKEKFPESFEESIEAPETRIREAAALHKFAEAAYTGPLLDVGRNPFMFPCSWLYRQGILSPWTRNRRPVLDGDNWWRGHAAAFLKYANLPPEALRHGRVNQVKCEAAYFIVVLHHLQTVVIAIRGTETPEDLITDGLCKECTLSATDLSGLINCNHIHSDIHKNVTSSFPHYGHSGIVEAARELFMQIEGNPGEHDSESYGLLSKLLGFGCECFGYNVRIVGHSLGGAIAALLGLQLYNRYPNLHVYSYGPLPCVDFVVANACSAFITSIIYGNEFSSRLSIGSIMRLRAAAITSLSQDPKADSAMIFRLARRFLYISQYERNNQEAEHEAQCEIDIKGSNKQVVQEASLWTDAIKRDLLVTADQDNDVHSIEDPVSQFIDSVPTSENQSADDPQEMYLPGFVIHIVPDQKRPQTDLNTSWRVLERGKYYRAYVANRENFKDIIVSPSMFLDHLPWRCHNALQKILKARTANDKAMEPDII